ncbi:antibiotic biosynthesis monooxygenase [Bacillus sp. PAMC26568]|nr:antibiotic biosynthesis monooxygenase [Bacillus sp. PAMC26568]
MIIIHAFLKVNPEQREAFLELAKDVVVHSQAEEGNISYQHYEDTVQRNTFVFLEEWKDQVATEFHSGTTHYKKFIEGIRPILLEPAHVKRYTATEQL